MSLADHGRPSAALPSPSPARPPSARPGLRPRLTVVPPLRSPAPRAPFVLLVGGLLCAGLIVLLYLHTALAEDSFRLHDLTTRSAALTDREQALEQEIADVAAPARLASRATALGMVASENPAFIRLSDGRILGRPQPGRAPVVKAKPSARPSAKPPAGAGAATGARKAAPAAAPTATAGHR